MPSTCPIEHCIWTFVESKAVIMAPDPTQLNSTQLDSWVITVRRVLWPLPCVTVENCLIINTVILQSNIMHNSICHQIYVFVLRNRVTCPARNIFWWLRERRSRLLPVSPSSPNIVRETAASVPAFHSSPVVTVTSYVTTETQSNINSKTSIVGYHSTYKVSPAVFNYIKPTIYAFSTSSVLWHSWLDSSKGIWLVNKISVYLKNSPIFSHVLGNHYQIQIILNMAVKQLCMRLWCARVCGFIFC